MGQYYEVQFAKQLDGSDNYGNITHSVKFVGENDSILWSHQPSTAIESGIKVYGRIDELMSKAGKPYKKFKREQPETQDGFAQQTTPAAGGGSFTPKKDNSDGMRQGMCFNNAANYVNTHNTDQMTPDQWAALVYSHASALYKLGDLNVPATSSVTVTDGDLEKAANGTILDEVDALFPGAAAA